jgi:recombination protein RecA
MAKKKPTLLSIDDLDIGIEFVPTGIAGFDYHYKGIAVGKLIEVFGAEDVGKSTFGFYLIKAFLEYFPEKYVLFLDFEKKLDKEYLKIIGIDMSRVLYADYDTIEDALESVRSSDNISLVIVDSLAAASTKQEIEGSIEDANMGVKARKIGQALRMLMGELNRKKTTLLIINQIRDNIGSYGGGITTPGGHSTKHHAILRLFMTKAKWDSNKLGQLLNIHVNKNHAGKKGITVSVHIDQTRVWEGKPPIDPVLETVNLAVSEKMLDQRGAYYYWNETEEQNIAQGFDNLVEYFKENKDEYQKLLSMIYLTKEE